MAEYIDKNKVVLNYGGLAEIAPDDAAGIAKYFADQIKAIPAEDVCPVKHGWWNRPYISWLFPLKIKNPYCFCTNCVYPVKSKRKSRYCPNCGAIMDGGAANAPD